MGRLFRRSALLLFTLLGCFISKAQHQAILAAPSGERLSALWRYCAREQISDWDSIAAHRFLAAVDKGADSLHDRQLKAYAEYFRRCWRILFSKKFQVYFPDSGHLAAIGILNDTKAWAAENEYPDIAASCENKIGRLHYTAQHYGLAFDHLLRADEAFKAIGYQQVPNAAGYLHSLGISFYGFKEYDKALGKLLEAARYPWYWQREELNSLNTIGLIYEHYEAPDSAMFYFREGIRKAVALRDTAWIGISAGNLGNIFIAKRQSDSALFYHRLSYGLNTQPGLRAYEDAAKTALSIAGVFLDQSDLDSASFYIDAGRRLAGTYIIDSTEKLLFRKKLLQVLIRTEKARGSYRSALEYSDSLLQVERQLHARLDNRILSRAVERAESEAYADELALLQSQERLTQLKSYTIIGGLLVLLLTVGFYFRTKWRYEKRQKEVADKDMQIVLTEKARAEEGLQHSKELLQAYLDTIREKSTLIEHLEDEVSDLKRLSAQVPELQVITANREELMASTILTDADWMRFRGLFEQVYPGFSQRLKLSYPELSPAETRFLYLAKLDLSTREMSTMLGISVDSLYKLRYRLRKKLNLEKDSDLETVLAVIDAKAI